MNQRTFDNKAVLGEIPHVEGIVSPYRWYSKADLDAYREKYLAEKEAKQQASREKLLERRKKNRKESSEETNG